MSMNNVTTSIPSWGGKSFTLADMMAMAKEVDPPKWRAAFVRDEAEYRRVVASIHSTDTPGEMRMFGVPIRVDPTVPPGEIEFRDTNETRYETWFRRSIDAMKQYADV